MLIRGDRLTPRQREIVLNAFPHRNTKEKPRQLPTLFDDKTGTTRFETRATQTDDEWLAEHAFHFLRDGSRLMLNRDYCEPVYLAD